MIGLEPKPIHIQWGLGLAIATLVLVCPQISSAAELNPSNPLNPPAPLYWCPNRTADQQLVVTPEPGCTPLVDKEEKETKPEELIKVQNIQNEASKFVRQYRQFLDCCATDVGSLKEIEDLEVQASDLLMSIQQRGLVNMANSTHYRLFTLREVIVPIAQARDDLRKLKTRLERLGESMERLDTLDRQSASREAQKIRAEQESIKKELQTKRPPESARTGMEIEDTTLPNRFGNTIGNATSGDTTLPNAFGPDIGYVTSPNSDQQVDLHPKRGLDIQDSNLPNRIGPATQDTTLPYSFGFEVDKKENPGSSSTTPSRVGPAVGDSSLNRRP